MTVEQDMIDSKALFDAEKAKLTAMIAEEELCRAEMKAFKGALNAELDAAGVDPEGRPTNALDLAQFWKLNTA